MERSNYGEEARRARTYRSKYRKVKKEFKRTQLGNSKVFKGL